MGILWTLLGLAIGAAGSMVVNRLGARRPAIAVWWWASFMVASVALSALELAQGSWWSAWMAVVALANGWMWWDWRKRKRAMATQATP